MQVRAVAVAAAAGLLLAALWSTGTFTIAAWWLTGLQRSLQSTLAGEITALRGGEPRALAALLAFCAAYGFLHAVGPGHGKLLVAGAAVGTATPVRRMAAIAVAGSLAQALFAVVLVYGGLAIVGATARSTIGASEAWALPVGQAAIALVGAMIAVRGLRAWRAERHVRDHGHAHDQGEACGCGHHHGPDMRAVEEAHGLPAALALVGAMAIRPCSGAMMLLAIAWSMGLAAAGVAGVLAMGLGTAAFTVAVAFLAVSGRETALAWLGGRAGGRLMPAVQIGIGLFLAASGATLLVSGLPA